MKGLLIKDLMTMAKMTKPLNYIVIILAIILSLIFLKGEGALYIALLLPLLLATGIPKTLLVYDEKCKWDRYAIALPVTRKSIVGSRYLLLGICVTFAAAIALLICFASVIIFQDLSFESYLKDIISGWLLSVLYGLIIVPSGYSMGGNGGPLVTMIMTFAIMGAFYVLRSMEINVEAILTYFIDNIIIISVAGLSILGIVSYYFLLYVYNSKHS